MDIHDYVDELELIKVMEDYADLTEGSTLFHGISVIGKSELIGSLFETLIDDGYDIGFIHFAKDFYDNDYQSEYVLGIHNGTITIDRLRDEDGNVRNVMDNVVLLYQDDVEQDVVDTCLGNSDSVTLFGFADECWYSSIIKVDDNEIKEPKEKEKAIHDILKEYCEVMDKYNESLKRWNHIDSLIADAFARF